MKKILFLGYNKNQTKIINATKDFSKKFNIYTSNKVLNENDIKKFNNIISFGYKNIIPKKIISKYKNKIINLHISYLPFNRGSHPNFWSFVENTPSGISIHEIDEGIDTGKIIVQKKIEFDIFANKNKYNFENTYKFLINEIENLFLSKLSSILNFDYQSYDQIGKGSYHIKNQLPSLLKSWNQKVYPTVIKYNKIEKKNINDKLLLLDKIENTRRHNNVNWMNILRVAIKNSPDETYKILNKINFDDQKISKLFKQIIK